jgi:hypothetical protein
MGHRLETRVNEASGPRDEGLYFAAWTGEASLLRDEVGAGIKGKGVGAGRRSEPSTIGRRGCQIW